MIARVWLSVLLASTMIACGGGGGASSSADAATNDGEDAREGSMDAATRDEDTTRGPDVEEAPDVAMEDAPDSADVDEVPQAIARYCGEDAAEIEARVEALLAEMSLAQKAQQMVGSNFAPENGLWRTPDDEALGIPGFAMVDGPRGVHKATGPATAFPVGMARGATWDPALETRVGEAMGREARARGASVLLAPTINILNHPRWGRAQETYGEDSWHIGRMGVGFVQGAQAHVMASAKHYTANAIEDTRFEVDVRIDEQSLREVYLPHFRALVQEANVASVMTSYNQVNASYCSENSHLLRDILKGDWQFAGFVESDWVFGTHTTVGAALGGLDIEMPFSQVYGEPLVEAVEAGEVDEALVDEAVRRILRAKLCYRLDTDPPTLDPSQVETPEHVALAREVARRAAVLLKNEDAALPIERADVARVAVIGPLADVANIGDVGSSDVEPSTVVTALAGLEAAAGVEVEVVHLPSWPFSDEDAAALGSADAVIAVVGYTDEDEGEGFIAAGDRERMTLSDEDIALIEAAAARHDRVVVVLEGGGSITMEGWLDEVEAVLMAWYPGMEGGHALAELIFGDAAPSGRLPIVFPVAEADLQPFDNENLVVTYDSAYGYRRLDRAGVAPRFPFGFGLSYTTFRYDALRLSSNTASSQDVIEVEVEVTNSGARTGIETVQLYVAQHDVTDTRPLKDLKAFAQATLAPGESTTLTLELPVARLARFDVERVSWGVEAGGYDLLVGPSSAELPLSAELTVEP